jgi:NAD(P)-dependent dehydrogenase (short-subunit alcohol dehydrogenase family)
MSVWFITGTSRGLGRDLAIAALDRGDQVVATGRDANAVKAALDIWARGNDNIEVVALDVSDPAQATAAVEAAVARFGRIDVVVNNAGYGMLGAVEETSDAEVREMFDVNVFGLLTVTRAALPILRRQRSGHVINIGSIAGFAAGIGSGPYAATKFAVEAITESLAGEVNPLGVRVTVVEPGAFRTDFLTPESIRPAATTLDDYAGTAGVTRTNMAASNGQQAGDPRKAAEAIVDLAHADNPPLRLQLGPDSVARVEAKLALVRTELDTWRHVSEATDFSPARVS